MLLKNKDSNGRVKQRKKGKLWHTKKKINALHATGDTGEKKKKALEQLKTAGLAGPRTNRVVLRAEILTF